MKKITTVALCFLMLVLCSAAFGGYDESFCYMLYCRNPVNQSKCSNLREETKDCDCYFLWYINSSLYKTHNMWYAILRVFENVSCRKALERMTMVDKIFTYLSMTNTTGFSLSGIRDVCRYVSEEEKQIISLDLSKKYKLYVVHTLSVENCCFTKIVGNFSYVFPLLTNLALRHNHLEVLESGVFQGLNRLEKIELNGNRLIFIGGTSPFAGLASLKYLDLSENRISKIGQNIFYDLVNLHVLKISKNDLQSLPPHLLRRNVELIELDMSSCNINISSLVEMGTDRLDKLERVYLENNSLSSLPPQIFHPNKSIKYLSLRNNKLSHLPFGAGQFIKLKSLDMTNNCFDLSKSDSPLAENLSSVQAHIKEFICPISVIDMSFLQKVAHLKTVLLSNFKYVHGFLERREMNITVDLTYPLFTDASTQLTETQIFISKSTLMKCELVTLMMIVRNNLKPSKGGLVRTNMTFVANDFYVGMRNYGSLNDVLQDEQLSTIICNFSFYCPKKCACTTEGFSEVITVDCAKRQLHTFPDIEEYGNPQKLYLNDNYLDHVPAMSARQWERFREIHLQFNWLVSLHNLELTPHLQVLDLRKNRLENFSVPQQWLRQTNYQTRLRLSENKWICGCEFLKMKNYVNASNNTDFVDVQCVSSSSKRLLYPSNATDVELCPPDPYLLLKLLLPLLVSSIVVISCGVLVCYRCRDFIKFWLFKHGICLRFVSEQDIDANKFYDAFISYSALDEDWVAEHLVPGLEKEPPFYKLCLHNRDWPAGEWISEQIVSSVKQSRRTMIILTENFMQSDWSLMEFKAARKQALADRVNRILIVLPGDVPESAKRNSELSTFMNFNIYTKWGDPHFWWKLRSGMPRIKDRRLPQDQQETAV